MGAPIVTPTITKYLLLNSAISASELFTVRDPEDDPITRYSFWDQSSNAATGYFRLSGAPQANGQKLFVAATELSSLQYVAGSQIGSETIRIAAKDLLDFGSEATIQVFFVKANENAPVLSTQSFTVLESESIFLKLIVTAFDPDGWPIQTYYFRDANAGVSGFFEDASTQYSQTTGHYFSAAQFQNVVYTGRLGGEQELVESYVFDGAQWSARSTFLVTTVANINRPTALFKQMNTSVARDRFISDLFTFFDSDGNTAKMWEIIDTNPHANSGSLKLNNTIFPSKTWFRVSAKDMASLVYTGAQAPISETFRFKVYDGKFWSAVQDAVVQNLERPIVSYDPLDFVTDLDIIPFSTFFSKVDQGPAYQWYEVIDRTVGFNTGKFAIGLQSLNTLAENQVHRLTPTQFANLNFRSGRFGTVEVDDLMFRVNNGTFTSTWEKMRVFTIPAFPTFMRQGEKADAVYSNQNGFNEWDDHYQGDAITYSFKLGYTDHISPDGATADNSFAFTAAQRLGVRQAFNMFSELLGVRFEEVSDFLTFPEVGQGGIIRFFNYNNPPPDAGNGERLGYVFNPMGLDSNEGGDVWVNTAFLPTSLNWSPGSNAFGHRALLSGIITALGVVPSQTVAGNSDYRSTIAAGPGLGADVHELSTGSPTPLTAMMNDVYALQQLYGANMNTRVGDTVYSIANSWNNDPASVAIIWDAGGNDTISAAFPGLARGATIDLRENHFSSIGTGVQNIGIAINAKIENAIGTPLADTVNGNDMGNRIETGAGNDTLWGNAGNDFLFGGAGNDNYLFEVGDDSDVIDEQQLGGVDRISVVQFPGVDSLSGDFTFRRDFRDLIIDLTIDGGESDGTFRIKDQRWGGSAVETLAYSFRNSSGNLQTVLVNLNSVYEQTTSSPQKFQLTTTNSSFGLLVSPVT